MGKQLRIIRMLYCDSAGVWPPYKDIGTYLLLAPKIALKE